MRPSPATVRTLLVIAFWVWGVGLMAPPAFADDDTPARYDLTVDLDPVARTLHVSGRLILTRENADDPIVLRLAPAFTLERLLIDGTPAQVTRQGAHLIVVPQTGARSTLDIAFTYDGTLPPLPDNGHGTAALMGGSWGAMLDESGYWYPQLAGQPARFVTRIRTPKTHRAVTTGQPTAETETDDGNDVTYDSLAPIAGLSLFAGRWQTSERTVATDKGDVLVRTWFRPHQGNLAPTYLDAAGRHLQGYAKTISPYPFGTFHIIAAPFPVGLGYPGLTYLGERILPFWFVPETSLRHEVAHNWWGNGIEIDYASGNWAEGLTTYMADYARARELGTDAAREMRIDWLRDFAALPASEDAPPVRFTAKTHDASQIIGYNKVAFFFHMLERKIGADAFAHALRRFWTDNAFTVAAWDDLRAAFEAIHGQDLKPFFDQWLTRTGAPSLALNDIQVAETDAGFETRFTVRQTQTDNPYGLDIPVVLKTETGTQETRLTLKGREAVFRIASAERPKHLAIDPGFDLFRRLDPRESPPILRDVTLNPETRVLIETPHRDAALDLARAVLSGAPRVVSDLADAPDGAPVLALVTPTETSPPIPRPRALPRADADAIEFPVDAWVGRNADGRAVLVVAAETETDLEHAARRLVHYGRKGYVRLVPGQRGTSGVSPVADGPLHRKLD